jgi:hypothetical protein
MPPGPGSIPAIASTGGGVTFAGTGTGTIVFDRPTDPTQTLHWESNLQELEEPFSIPDIRNGAQPNQHPNLPLAAPQPPQQMADPSVAHAVQDNKKSRTKARTIRTTQTGPELLKKTASDFLEGHPLATFVCPLETCSVELPAYSTLSTLWEHCDDSHHQVGLYAQEHYPCEIGCNIGFTDPCHRMDHYAKAKCFSGQISSTQCPESECSWTPSLHKPESFRRGQVLSHYTEAHAPHAYHQDGYFKDDACQLGFVNNVDLYFHCLGGQESLAEFRSSASNATSAHLTGVINGFPTLSNIVTHLSCTHRDTVLRQFSGCSNIVVDPHIQNQHITFGNLLGPSTSQVCHNHSKYDPVMCTSPQPENTLALNGRLLDRSSSMWTGAMLSAQEHLPTLRNRILYQGDYDTAVWFVSDVDAVFPANPNLSDEDIKSLHGSLTGVEEGEYGPNVACEPYSCSMPGCQERFEGRVTVLEFYLHMEDDTHAKWLFTTNGDYRSCALGCLKAFINEHSLLRHYMSSHCQGNRHDNNDQHIGIQQHSDSYPSVSGDTTNIDSSYRCESCKTSFAGERALWNHVTGQSLQPSKPCRIAATLRKALPWVIPDQYAPSFPTRALLRSTYDGGRGGQYVIFIYRDSSDTYEKVQKTTKNNSTENSKDRLTRHCRNFIRYLRRTGQARGKVSFVVIRASEVKSALSPSFGIDILETSMGTGGLPLPRQGAESAAKTAFMFCGKKTLTFTALIGAHVVHALSRGQTPIIVSNGINAFSTHWQRVRTYMELVHQAYGDIPFVIRLPSVADTKRFKTMCPVKDNTLSYGFYTTGQIAEGKDEGVLA